MERRQNLKVIVLIRLLQRLRQEILDCLPHCVHFKGQDGERRQKLEAIVLTHFLQRLRQEILDCPLHCVQLMGHDGEKIKN